MSTNIIRGNIAAIYMVKVALKPAALTNTANTGEQTFSVQGIKATDFVISAKPSHDTGVGIGNVRVPSDGKIAVMFFNMTGSTLTPASETYTFIVARPENPGNLLSALPA